MSTDSNWNSEEPIVSPDTENRTHFHPVEASPEQREKYKRLFNYNTGIFNGEWADESKRRRLDNLALFDAVANQLELTRYQHRYGRDLFDSINFNRLGYHVDLIAFCVCMLVAREDGRMYHPKRASTNNDPLFDALADDLGFRRGVIEACFNRILEVVK